MRDDLQAEDYEVGYGKPPKHGEFKKGVSGNPKGRPKKVLGFGAQVMRELNSKLTITDQGKQVVITKFEVIVKQAVNKAAKGNLRAIKLVADLRHQELEKGAEEQRSSPFNPTLVDLSKVDARDLSDEQLIEVIRAVVEEQMRAELEKSITAKLQKSIRAELEKSIRAELEKSGRDNVEGQIASEAWSA
jgi:hypothetical protein